jgi:hypothetical protein
MFVVTGTFGVISRKRRNLILHELDCLVGDKPLPIEVQAVNRPLAMHGRGFDLRPIRVGVTPKGRPPRLIQRFQRTVPFLQPRAECFLTKRAVAFAAVFVGVVPDQQCRVPGYRWASWRLIPAVFSR